MKVTNNMAIKNKKIILYLHYDIHNIIDEHIIYQLKSYHDLGIEIIFISNSNLSNEEIHKVTDFTTERILHHNRGYDFTAWKDVILSKGKDFFTSYDDLIITNSTCYGPIFSFEEMFNEMDNRNPDLWGIGIRSPYMGFDYHIGSYFVSFSKKVFTSKIFWRFWQTIKAQYTYWGVIRHGELRLTTTMAKKFKYDAYSKLSDLRPCEKLGHHENYCTSSGGYFCEKGHSPLLKVKSFYNQRENPYSHSGEIFDMFKRIESSYPIELIINHQKRTSPLSWLRNFPNMLHIADCSIQENSNTELAVFIALENEELLDFYYQKYGKSLFSVQVAIAPNLLKKIDTLGVDNWKLKVIPTELENASWGVLIKELFPELLKNDKIILVNNFQINSDESDFFNCTLRNYTAKSMLLNSNFMQNCAEILAQNNNCGLLLSPIAPELLFCDYTDMHSKSDIDFLKKFYNQAPYPMEYGVPTCMLNCCYIKSGVLHKLIESNYFADQGNDNIDNLIAYALQKMAIETQFVTSAASLHESSCKLADNLTSYRKFGVKKHISAAIELTGKAIVNFYHKILPAKATQKLMYFEEPIKQFLKKLLKRN